MKRRKGKRRNNKKLYSNKTKIRGGNKMAKKRDEFRSETDYVRFQLRELAKEMGIEMKDIHLMRKEECNRKLKELAKEKFKKELETPKKQEPKEAVEKIKKELTDRSNQITILEEEKVTLKSAKEAYKKENERLEIEIKTLKEENIETIKNLEESYKALNELSEKRKEEIKELQEINQIKKKIIEARTNELAENRKEIEEKNREISELKAERNSSQLSLDKKEREINQIKEESEAMINDKNEIIDVLQEEIEQLGNRKWYQFWK